MFAADLTSQLPGPDWLHEQRRAAIARAEALPMPTFEAEEWRYSPIGELEQDTRAFGALMVLAAIMSLAAWAKRRREALAHALGAVLALVAIMAEPDLLTSFLAMAMALLSLSLIAELMSSEWLARRREARRSLRHCAGR